LAVANEILTFMELGRFMEAARSRPPPCGAVRGLADKTQRKSKFGT
jgi:hypothetical protein